MRPILRTTRVGTYQSLEDLAAEERIRAALNVAFAPWVFHKWGRFDVVDTYALDDERTCCVGELKHRNYDAPPHTTFITCRAWRELTMVSEALQVPGLFVNEWDDGKIRGIDIRAASVGPHHSATRRSPGRIPEPQLVIPSHEFWTL